MKKRGKEKIVLNNNKSKFIASNEIGGVTD